jgi:PilZ domain-containing protein
MSANRRKSVRRAIGYKAKVVASDGSWTRDCRVLDVSQSGAKLAIDQPAELPSDFILALSERGAAMRRCHVVWTAEREIGVKFERPAAEVSSASSSRR